MPPLPSTIKSEEFFALAGFSQSFAAFLRRHSEDWRRRRIDRFTPVDIHLATRQTSLQGVIEAPLMAHFLDEREQYLRIKAARPRSGDRLTCVIPAASMRKQLVLDFSIRNEAGGAVPMLTRMDGSQLAAQDLLALLVEGIATAPPKELNSPTTVVALLEVLTALAFQNPHALARRIPDIASDSGLPPDALRDWIRFEGEFFLAGLGEPLEEALETIVARQGGLTVAIAQADRVGGLRHFDSLASLLLHGVRDLLKVAVEWAPARPSTSRPSRRELLSDPARLADHITTEIVPAIDLLMRILSDQKSEDAESELLRHLDRWTVYTCHDVQIDVPFIVKLQELLPLGDRRRVSRVWHNYPIAYKDAAAYHVEVRIEDRELRCNTKPQIVSPLEGASTVGEGFREAPLEWFFGSEFTEADHLIHLYSSRRFNEGADLDRALRENRFTPFLRVRLKKTPSVVAGYATAAVAFALGAAYCVYGWWDPIQTATEPSEISTLLTVTGFAVTLSLWLTSVRHPRPVVHRSLYLARFAFVTAIGVMLLLPLVFLGHLAYDRLPEDLKPGRDKTHSVPTKTATTP